jgi:histidinol phosphatase-like enzyme
MSGIGHNGGPLLESPDADRGYALAQTWRRAYKEAHRQPSAAIAKLRAQAAEELGMAYEDYAAILWDRGRRPRALVFELGGTLVRTRNGEVAEDRRGGVTLMPGVREKLMSIRNAQIFVVTNQARIAEGSLSRENVEDYIHQVSNLCGDVIRDHHIGAETRANAPARKAGMITKLLAKHFVPVGQGVMISDTVEDERSALMAGLARYIWSWRYFGEPLPALARSY